ncbi:MAG: hypothetical protein K6A76_03830 [Oribacterium sp.]|nr:hypothetical protein [Oribacterium sp.]
MISKKLSIAFCISFLVILSSCGKADSQDIANTTTEIKVTTEKAVEFWKDSKYTFEMILIDKSGEIFITEGLKNNYKSDGKINIISKA